jgi:hypothetical protein
MSVNVFFLGLICHVGLTATQKRFAAAVDAPDHNAYLHYDKGTKKKALVNGISLEFGDLGRGQAKTTPNFNNLVAHLRGDDLAQGDLKNDVNQGTNTSDVHAYTYFPPASHLFASRRYPHQAAYVRKSSLVHITCVARLTRLEIDHNQALEVKPLGITIAPDSPCLISNLGPPSSSLDESHTRHFRFLLDNGLVADTLELVSPCVEEIENDIPDWVLKVIRSLEPESINVECGNTQWP